MFRFTLATLLPLPLIAAAALRGGIWALAALVAMTSLTALLDILIAKTAHTAPDQEFPAANTLSVILGLSHFALLGLCITVLGRSGLNPFEKFAVFTAAGLYFGQVSNSNAHELIHRGKRHLHLLGTAVYTSVLFGHHTSAHKLVHHIHVATSADPNSARLGESFYHFAMRAWRGSFSAGLRAESARLSRSGRAKWRHPYVGYGAGAALMLVLAALLAGPSGVVALFGLASFAQMQLLMSDYVQHYGLRRALLPGGKPEPVGDQHSWNAGHAASSALMLNAPRHSDHHSHPNRPYPQLALPPHIPILPRSLPVMAVVALMPGLWRRKMDPLVRQWSAPEP
ncbi:MAG: alkane 1-monooxygenase [Rhodobacteraceae bacterium]|nr:alkane 1-monooxygenase [Paracoccaceae bacterium]